ncbi:helix-turn-helix domain-containing protein [Halopelagius longus]|uniref:Predicted DNA binding protein, contains HTH domain n=1 Tax=Halopelagius longus TaxID=1236180 RepID=A0A1H0YRA8_9EURY|nr:helix-turn-helix domain-containing protein [Halopelagius longus]RDI72635.1 winged helix-turn-helix transcriptional regulator [Halopelagius longus]SDQ17704.1 Predicted DNA binding protein, contains HTH domain [Halopelagius longus]
MTIAEVHVSHPDFVLGRTIEAMTEVEIRPETQPVQAGDALVLFFSVEGNFEGFEEVLAADHTVTDPRLVAELEDRRIYRVQLTDRAKLVTYKLAELGIYLSEIAHDDGGWRFRALLPDLDSLTAFREYCKAENITFRVKAMYQNDQAATRGGFGLTDGQREALLLAFDRGYFSDPREITLQELAEEMGISSTACGRRLRRASEQLIESTVVSER